MQVNSSKKVLGLFDVSIMTVSAVFGIRWLSFAAGLGMPSILFWVVGALVFFLPLSIMIAQLSRQFPQEGGIYAWVRQGMGEKSGFLTAWFYWVNAIFFYPAVLIFLSGNVAYLIGKPELANSPAFVTPCVIIMFWAIIFFCIFGLRVVKWVVNIGGVFGAMVPAAFLIFFGALAYIKYGSATPITFSAIAPNGRVMDNLSSLALIMFAMSGSEIIPTFANSVRNPKRDLYIGVILGTVLILILYILGTLSMNVLNSPDNVQKASGLIQSFAIVDQKFNIPWFTKLISFLFVLAETAAISIWIIAPAVMFFKCTPNGVLPKWLHKTDKHGTPVNAVIFQGILASLIMLVTNLLPSVNAMYQVLALMATVLFFIPYLFLAIAYVKLMPQLKMNNLWGMIMAIAVFVSVVFGIVISFVPSSDLTTLSSKLIYEIELIAGTFIFVILGYWLYHFRVKNKHE